MAHLDESEYDDRARDGRAEDERSRGRGGRRASQPARPAWDAATYGTPDDLRRTRPPSRGRAPDPDYGSPDAGSSEDYRSSYPDAGSSDGYGSSYPDDGYRSGYPNQSDPYATGSTSASYADPYAPSAPADPYAPSAPFEPYPPADPYSSDRYAASAYAAPAEPYAPAAPYAPVEPYAPPAEPDRYDRYAPEPLPTTGDPYPYSSGSASMYAPEPYPDGDPYSFAADPFSADPYRAGSHAAGDSGPPDGEPAGGRSSRRSYGPPPDSPDRYPGGSPAGDAPGGAPEPSPGRAGRNLPAAIGVGVGLGAIVVASLFVWRPAFLIVLVAAVGIGVWELVRAIRTSGANPPLIPLIAGGVLMMGLAWWGHADALTFGLMVTVLAAMVWRLADGAGDYGRDVAAATLVAVYVPFLAGFAALLATPPDGAKRVVVMVAGVVLSDTGGYIAGVLFGRHPMAPSVSPKKSWEGLVGSLIASGVGGALMLYFLFHVSFGWGVLFGLAVSVAAVVGDLGESMIKRDLKVKDMSQLLPGHGGLMDRLDSILFAAPTAYFLLLTWAPPL